MKLKEKNFMQINKQQNDEEETCNETWIKNEIPTN
jgi:hypothetical protein